MKGQILAVLLALVVAGCQGQSENAARTLVIYSGRSQSLVEPLIQAFEAETGVEVRAKYGNSAQLALALQEEGDKTPADVFWSQDAGALSILCTAGFFVKLPDDVYAAVPAKFRHDGGEWVATSGRARVFAYAPSRVSEGEIPESVFELTGDKWKGRVGWAPMNASFQSFVTAMRKGVGDDKTAEWLQAMKANGAKAYPKNTAIIEAIAAGEVDLGLPNHYYLLRFKKSDPDFPVEQSFFRDGDVGNLVNVAGVGILRTAKNVASAERFVQFLLSPPTQQYFSGEVFEYPVIGDASASASLVGLNRLSELAPKISLSDLEDLSGTLELLRKVGLL